MVCQMRDERRKLRINIEEANTRAALLAQEVDDNHAKLENSLQNKLLYVKMISILLHVKMICMYFVFLLLVFF